MDERLRFVARFLDDEKMATLCRAWGGQRRNPERELPALVPTDSVECRGSCAGTSRVGEPKR